MRHVIEIAAFARIVEVDGGRQDAVANREDREDRLDAACRSEQMPGHRLGRAHRDLLRVLAERMLDRNGLGDVACRRRGAVGVDVIDLLRIELGVAHRVLHRTTRTVAVIRRQRDVRGIRRHAEADKLRMDAGAARLGELVIFENEHAGTVAEHETVAILVPGTRSALRIVIARRQCTRLAETSHAGRRGTRLGTTGNDDVGISGLNQAHADTNGMSGRCTGRHGSEARAGQTEIDRDVARHHVDDRSWNEEGRDASRPLLRHLLHFFLDEPDTTDA